MDFGGAAAVIDSLDDSFGSTVVGDVWLYAAGTVMSARAATTASDLYGIGATILFLLSGRPPSGFKTERLRINFDDVFIEDRRLRLVVARLLEPSPEDRFRNAQEALDALDSTAVAPMGGRNFRSSRSTMDSPASTMNSPRSTTEQLPAAAPGGARNQKTWCATSCELTVIRSPSTYRPRERTERCCTKRSLASRGLESRRFGPSAS